MVFTLDNGDLIATDSLEVSLPVGDVLTGKFLSVSNFGQLGNNAPWGVLDFTAITAGVPFVLTGVPYSSEVFFYPSEVQTEVLQTGRINVGPNRIGDVFTYTPPVGALFMRLNLWNQNSVEPFVGDITLTQNAPVEQYRLPSAGITEVRRAFGERQIKLIDSCGKETVILVRDLSVGGTVVATQEEAIAAFQTLLNL